MADIFTYVVDLPSRITEAVTPCLDGYTVYINRNLDRKHQQKAFMHAIAHIINDDFEKYDVQQIESEAHDDEETYYN